MRKQSDYSIREIARDGAPEPALADPSRVVAGGQPEAPQQDMWIRAIAKQA